MRRPSPYDTQSRRGELDVKMTPMIDVVFLLLVFFVWTASFQVAEHLLPTRLTAAAGAQTTTPRETPPPEADFDDVVVRIMRIGDAPVWRVNNEPISGLAELRGVLQGIADVKRDAPVVLHPDYNVPLGDVIDVYDLSLLVGFEKVQFATGG